MYIHVVLTYLHTYSTHQIQGTYKARVNYTRLHEEANTCLYKETNAFTREGNIHLVPDVPVTDVIIILCTSKEWCCSHKSLWCWKS